MSSTSAFNLDTAQPAPMVQAAPAPMVQQPPPLQPMAGQMAPNSPLLASILQSMSAQPPASAPAGQTPQGLQMLVNAIKASQQGDGDPNAMANQARGAPGGLVGMGLGLNPGWGNQ